MVVPRCGVMVVAPEGRIMLLFGGVNGRNPPRFGVVMVELGLPVRIVELLISRPPWNVPALGFCMVPFEPMPRATLDSPKPLRPPGEIAET